MFMHNKRLMYTVRAAEPDPALAGLLLRQFGCPQDELGSARRCFGQAQSESDPGRKDLLFAIATEEMGHLGVIGSLVVMLNRGHNADLDAGGGELMAEIGQGGESHATAMLHDGAGLMSAAGTPLAAPDIGFVGEPTVDLCANLAAEARARAGYARLLARTADDPDVRDAVGFLMTREIAHHQALAAALYAIAPEAVPAARLA